MKAKEGVINILNEILTVDLLAINQYFVHAKMCEHWGYERLHQKVRERSIDEMKDADTLIGHIFYLEGIPKVRHKTIVHLGETVPQQLQFDLKSEQDMLTLRRHPEGEGPTSDMIQLPIGATLEEIERTFILATLKHFEGDKRRAADVLGCSLKTLYNKLHAYQRDRGAGMN